MANNSLTEFPIDQSIFGLRNTYSKEALPNTVSYDIEGYTDIKNRGSYINTFYEGFYSSEQKKSYINYIKDHRLSGDKLEKTLNSESFFRNLLSKAKQHGVYKPFSEHNGTPHNLASIQNELSSGVNVGVWNIGFEGKAFVQDTVQSASTMPTLMPKGMTNPWSAYSSSNTGGVIGMNDVLAKKYVENQILGKTAKADKSLVGQYQKSTIGLAEDLVHTINNKAAGAPGMLYDYSVIARGFTAKLEQQGHIKALTGDYGTGLGVSNLVKVFRDAGMWSSLDETHLPNMDAAQAHEIGNFMANYLLNPDDKIGAQVGKHLDIHRVARAGEIVREKVAQGKSILSWELTDKTDAFSLGKDTYEFPRLKGTPLSEAEHVASLGLSDDLLNVFNRGIQENGTKITEVLDDIAGGKMPKTAGDILTKVEDKLGGVYGKLPRAAKFIMPIAAGFAGYMALLNTSEFVNPSTQSWGRASKFGVADQNMWSGMAEEFEEDMTPGSRAIVTHGTEAHESIQNAFKSMFPGAVDEYTVIDWKNKITGHIDLVVPLNRDGKIVNHPIEIKTISGKGLSELTGPKEEHIAQSQFYLDYLSRENPDAAPTHETFLYVSRDDPSQYKIFHEERNPEKFKYYLDRYRQYQQGVKSNGLTPQRMDSNLNIVRDRMLQQAQMQSRELPSIEYGAIESYLQTAVRSSGIEKFGKAAGLLSMPKGVRSSNTPESAYGGFEAMQPNTHSEFPGGRVQNFTKAVGELSYEVNYAVKESISKPRNKTIINTVSSNNSIHYRQDIMLHPHKNRMRGNKKDMTATRMGT